MPTQSASCSVRAAPVGSARPDLEHVVHAIGVGPGLVVLDGAAGPYSIVAADPVALWRCAGPDDPDPFAQLADAAGRIGRVQPAAEVPFGGGFMGYIGYEARVFVEPGRLRAARDLELPFTWLGLYDTAAVLDHRSGAWHAAGVELPVDLAPGRPPVGERLEALVQRIRRAGGLNVPPPPAPPRAAGLGPPAFGAAEYMDQVRTVLEHIRAGDIYQANLTCRFAVACRQGAWQVFRRLRRANPAPYAAFLECGDFQVLSCSPELFLQIRGREILTRPIKGTRPRGADPAADAALQAELAASEKDLAELAMIVDLERNDLGKIAGGIEVDWPPVIETHPTVHHLVAAVRGTLTPECTPADILRATFPGGSITGCPKIRAMQIIDTLEPVARGPYCGAIGYIGVDGNWTLNVAIRTMVVKHGQAFVHAGSGIVADSDPAAEFDELQAKAAGMFAALGLRTRPEGLA